MGRHTGHDPIYADQEIELTASLAASYSAHSPSSSTTGLAVEHAKVKSSTNLREDYCNNDAPLLPGKGRSGLHGWRSGANIAAITTSIIGLLNLVITIWLASTHRQVDGIGAVYRGPCETTNKIALTVHLAINVLSSLLLAASNYCMQCLAAPTRAECDRAHGKHDWLDVGVNSMRNLRKIGRFRAAMWILLALSSLPIHLLYNSSFFKVLSTNAFSVFVVNPAFLSDNHTDIWTPTPAYFDIARAFGGSSTNCSFVNTGGRAVQRANSCGTNCAVTSFSQPEVLYFSRLENYNNITYANGTSVALDFSRTRYTSDPYALLAPCKFTGCDLEVDNTTLVQPSMRDAIHRCYNSTDLLTVDWAGNATSARRNMPNAQWKRLELPECIDTYGQDFISDWNNVFFVTDNTTNTTAPSAWAQFMYLDYEGPAITEGLRSPHDWLCADRNSQVCNVNDLRGNLTNYKLGGVNIDYCMAQPVTDAWCQLQYSTNMLMVVVICNAIKAAVMFITVYWRRDTTFVVLGDAIASYLDRPDEFSRDRCLLTARKAQIQRRSPSRYRPFADMSLQIAPQTYVKHSSRVFRAVSTAQLLLVLLLAAVTIITAGGLLGLALETIRTNFGSNQSPWSLGFGTANGQTILSQMGGDATSTSGLVASVLLSNTPQVIVSFVYVMYNGVLTAMIEGIEWSRYAHAAKALRVTVPQGAQRSTYFISLPYRYGVPLLVASAVLHWLISASLFLVKVETYASGAEDLTGLSLSFVGYSPLPILLAVILGTAMVLGAGAVGMRRLDGTMPIVGSNSLAIAAACHPPVDDTDAALMPVQWGEVSAKHGGEIGHCTFTSYEVTVPVGRKSYQ